MDSPPSDPIPAESALIKENLLRWPQAAGGEAVLINLSENHTFRIDMPDGHKFALRLHRPRYQSRRAIGSELAWLEAITDQTEIPVPRPIPGADGEIVQELAPDRFAALFAFEKGEVPSEDDGDLTDLFATLGRYAATLHKHVAEWQQPEQFVRPIWDAAGILEPDSPWGDWRKAPGVEGDDRETLDALDAQLREDLRAYGTDIDRFGLIHADMRLANLLVEDGEVLLLDFDDSGYGWFLYDLAASLSFIETSPQVPALIRAWLAGYLELRTLKPEDIRMIDAMILLRRMALLAWIGSHGETALAQRHAGRFAADTADMARKYLSR